MVVRLRAALLAAFFVLPAARVAQAHDVSYAHAELHWRSDRIDVSLTVHAEDAGMVIGVPMPEWFSQPEFVARAGPTLADSLRRRFALRADGRELAWRHESAHPDAQGRGATLELVAPLEHPAAQLEFDGPLFPGVTNHQTYVSVYAGDSLLLQDVLTESHRHARAFAGGVAGTGAVLRTFVWAGVHHIAIGPDHILFVLGLLLLGGGVARLLKVVTAFTLAHSVTLALAALGLVRVSARIVEPMIALSIVVVAFETLRARGRAADQRAPLAFAFGLVHGFGFASVLAEFGLPRAALGWALAGFNLGVEAGQAVLVVAVSPLLVVLARRWPAWHARVVTALALLIAAAGAYWLVSRILADL
ncbi:MAG: HupE/UreJ family protein [Candidatus Eisenbacteria bacterium]